MKLYVGNLPYNFAAQDLKTLFSNYGTVVNVTIVTDRDTGQSRGFAFVEMSSRQQGEAAIESLNGQKQGGRTLIVNEAKPQEKREGGGRSFDKRREQRPFSGQRRGRDEMSEG